MNARVQTSALGRFLAWLKQLHERWYASDERWHRRWIEMEARRLGGRLTWDDTQ